MNRMRCKLADGNAWTTVRVRELRERLGIAAFDPTLSGAETISADAAAIRLGICVGSVQKLIRKGVLPATQLMPSAPWQIPVVARETEVVVFTEIKDAVHGEHSVSLRGCDCRKEHCGAGLIGVRHRAGKRHWGASCSTWLKRRPCHNE
jgi:hypothetical protein